MKKILALTLTGLLAFCGAGAINATATTSVPQSETSATEIQLNKLYLVPGTYMSEGNKVENTISSGATKLSEDDCEAIYTENAYLCTLSEGETLPAPASVRQDKDGNLYSFNGWWTIVDATVTYFETVPELSETTFLYADWRADLSQRKDPVEVDDTTIVKPLHYMSIKRAKTGETDIITLRVSGTDVVDAETLGYGAPVQLYNGWFELNPGDEITVYASGLGDFDEPQAVPFGSNSKITLENSGDGSNITSNYLTADLTNFTLTYRKVQRAGYFRIYFKFKTGGSQMLVYMEKMG